MDTSAGDAVMGYKIGSFYITELCSALTRYAPKLDLMNSISLLLRRGEGGEGREGGEDPAVPPPDHQPEGPSVLL